MFQNVKDNKCCIIHGERKKPRLGGNAFSFSFLFSRFGLSNKFDTEFPSVLTGKVSQSLYQL